MAPDIYTSFRAEARLAGGAARLFTTHLPLFWTSVRADELLTAEVVPIVKPARPYHFLFSVPFIR